MMSETFKYISKTSGQRRKKKRMRKKRRWRRKRWDRDDTDDEDEEGEKNVRWNRIGKTMNLGDRNVGIN